AVRYLPDQFSVSRVVIEMLPACPLAEDDKRAVLQPVRQFHATNINPCLSGFAKYSFRLAACRISIIQIEPGLFAVLNFINDLLAVRIPADSNDQRVNALILRRVHPLSRAARCADYAEAHYRIWIARFRIELFFDFLKMRDVINDCEFVRGTFIKAQVSNAGRIWTPPVALEVPTPVKLFLINPVELPVENLACAVCSQGAL